MHSIVSCVYTTIIELVFSAINLTYVFLSPVSNSSLTSVYQPLYCNKATDCWPDNDVSIDLVSCFYNSCLCMGCFTINTTTGGCQVLDCFAYDGTCVDRRQSQLATFLLSLFLSPFGVGNFYIAQWGLGAAQISLFVFFLLSCTGCCITRRLSSESRNQVCCCPCHPIRIIINLLTLLVIMHIFNK